MPKAKVEASYASRKRKVALGIEERIINLINRELDWLEGQEGDARSLKLFIDSLEKMDGLTREERKSPSDTMEDKDSLGASLSEIVDSQSEEIKSKLKEMLGGKFGNS